ncbi:MAG: single-stranded-DNA-specific exonuclease RecJ [Gemmatimonadota bacterium]
MIRLVRPRYEWVEPAAVPPERGAALAAELGLPVELCDILVRRGLGEPQAAKRFLRPDPRALHSPHLLPDMQAAVDRVESAVTREETVLVHGDYDADGLSGTALLTRGLAELGAKTEPFVPHRTKDGYDLGAAGLARARQVGAALILTVDCGVSAMDPVRQATEAGIDVVITDHHRPGPELPPASAVVNPNRKDSTYPFRGLAGVGVAFKLLTALYDRAGVPEERLNQHLDLVAIGTVSDLAPLEDENRVLVRLGLRALGRTRKPGLAALVEATGLGHQEIGARDVGFGLAPRLNAAGRIGTPEESLRLLLTEEEAEARGLALRLNDQNERRRAADRRVVAEAEAKLATSYVPERDRVVVLWEEGWPLGVLGLAASRLAQRLHRPTVLLTFDGERGRGSARSVEGFHLFRALEACGSVLERFGGHRMAAGLDIRRSRLDEFVERFTAHGDRVLGAARLAPRLRIDLALPLRSVTPRLHRSLSYLEPHGEGNPRPVLVARGVALSDPKRVGQDASHLKATLRDEGARVEAIGFRLGQRLEELRGATRWDVAFELEEEVWRERRRLSARVLDFRPALD